MEIAPTVMNFYTGLLLGEKPKKYKINEIGILKLAYNAQTSIYFISLLFKRQLTWTSRIGKNRNLPRAKEYQFIFYFFTDPQSVIQIQMK